MTSRDFGITTLRNAVAYHLDGSIVPSNNVYITSTNGAAVFSDTLTISTIYVSTATISTLTVSTIDGGGVSSILAVNAGTNISIPDPLIPVVSVDINSTLNMNGFPIVDTTGLLTLSSIGEINLTAGSSINMNTSTITSFANKFILNSDLDIKGSSASIQFFDILNNQKATINYADINQKITITASSSVFESTGPGKGRLIFDSLYSYIELRGDNIPVRMRKYDSVGTAVSTAVALEGNNIILTTGGTSTIQIGPNNISSTYLLLTINNTAYKIALLT